MVVWMKRKYGAFPEREDILTMISEPKTTKGIINNLLGGLAVLLFGIGFLILSGLLVYNWLSGYILTFNSATPSGRNGTWLANLVGNDILYIILFLVAVLGGGCAVLAGVAMLSYPFSRLPAAAVYPNRIVYKLSRKRIETVDWKEIETIIIENYIHVIGANKLQNSIHLYLTRADAGPVCIKIRDNEGITRLLQKACSRNIPIYFFTIDAKRNRSAFPIDYDDYRYIFAKQAKSIPFMETSHVEDFMYSGSLFFNDLPYFYVEHYDQFRTEEEGVPVLLGS
ncbi:hypothetical protein ATL39_0189 [Sinobaca qinghaiensis]|uniref:Uncharacterized protein n=2 Tax=Sinobaca qinghaiensis TaxID=342944 RepID=A0A419V7S3_9BACL|nr:hypothetical protein ATL39_0189 [Sinobaca qinghaiensis]